MQSTLIPWWVGMVGTDPVCSVLVQILWTVSDNISLNPSHSHLRLLSTGCISLRQGNWNALMWKWIGEPGTYRIHVYVFRVILPRQQQFCIQPEERWLLYMLVRTAETMHAWYEHSRVNTAGAQLHLNWKAPLKYTCTSHTLDHCKLSAVVWPSQLTLCCNCAITKVISTSSNAALCVQLGYLSWSHLFHYAGWLDGTRTSKHQWPPEGGGATPGSRSQPWPTKQGEHRTGQLCTCKPE